MIDLHHHCLPAVDDGPRDWDEAVALCRLAADEGVETIVATPHVLRGRWKNTARTELQAKLDELQTRIGPAPRLLLGSEYFFAHDVNEVLDAGDVVPLAGTRYVLIEFNANSVPPMVEQPLYRMQLGGWTPLIAHPERNLVFQSKPQLLETLVRLGAKTQVTTGSFVGRFGSEARDAAFDFVRRGIVHVVATDAHNVAKRPPVVREARRVIEEAAGARIAQALFVDNPAAILAGRGLVYEPDLPYPTNSSRFLDRLKRLLGIS